MKKKLEKSRGFDLLRGGETEWQVRRRTGHIVAQPRSSRQTIDKRSPEHAGPGA